MIEPTFGGVTMFLWKNAIIYANRMARTYGVRQRVYSLGYHRWRVEPIADVLRPSS